MDSFKNIKGGFKDVEEAMFSDEKITTLKCRRCGELLEICRR